MKRPREERNMQPCPKCGSREVRKYGTRIISGGSEVQRYQCTDCGHVFNSTEEAKE